MPTIVAIAAFLERVAPFRLAEEWDNVGLLVGHRTQEIKKLMTCLTVTPASAAEAIDAGADLIVTHHPMPFVATKRLTDDTVVGRLLLDLIASQIAVYSSHTAFDSASQGVNDRLAGGLGRQNIVPLVERPHAVDVLGATAGLSSSAESTVGQANRGTHAECEGTGRWGSLPEPITLGELAERLKQFLSIEHLQMVGERERLVRVVAVGCGAADELLDAARTHGCDAMVVGEARFHTCLEAEAMGIGLVLPGHFASERFAMESLAEVLGRQFPEITVWASRRESDPIQWQ
jgi:dinuclear metal center YbgI/SA1388 family protein